MEKGSASYTIERVEKLAALYNMDVMDLLKLSDQNIFHNISNSATHNVSDNITINNGLNDDEFKLYKEVINKLESQNEILIKLVAKISEKFFS